MQQYTVWIPGMRTIMRHNLTILDYKHQFQRYICNGHRKFQMINDYGSGLRDHDAIYHLTDYANNSNDIRYDNVERGMR